MSISYVRLDVYLFLVKCKSFTNITKNIKRELSEKVLTNQNTRAYTLGVNDNNTDSKGGESHETE